MRMNEIVVPAALAKPIRAVLSTDDSFSTHNRRESAVEHFNKVHALQ